MSIQLFSSSQSKDTRDVSAKGSTRCSRLGSPPDHVRAQCFCCRYAALAPGTYHIQVRHAYPGLADPAYTYTLRVREAAPGSES
jgi:hypothetical protein